MASNFPGTYELRIAYVTDEPTPIAQHGLRLSMEMATPGPPGSAFSAWTPVDRLGASPDTMITHLSDLLDVLKPNFSTGVDFTTAEIWEYAPGTYDAVFRAAASATATGTNVSATVPYSQTIWTMRSANGGAMKVDLRGTPQLAAGFSTFPTGDTAADDLLAYFLDTNSVFHARDQGFPVAGYKWLRGSNEHAFKKVNR